MACCIWACHDQAIEEEETGDMDDPFAMMGGMGEEEVYQVTLMKEVHPETVATEIETKKASDNDEALGAAAAAEKDAAAKADEPSPFVLEESSFPDLGAASRKKKGWRPRASPNTKPAASPVIKAAATPAARSAPKAAASQPNGTASAAPRSAELGNTAETPAAVSAVADGKAADAEVAIDASPLSPVSAAEARVAAAEAALATAKAKALSPMPSPVVAPEPPPPTFTEEGLLARRMHSKPYCAIRDLSSRNFEGPHLSIRYHNFVRFVFVLLLHSVSLSAYFEWNMLWWVRHHRPEPPGFVGV